MSDSHCCKVGFLVDRYDLASAGATDGSIDDHLVARWLGTDGRSSVGYRTLTDWFNRQLLKRAYDRANRTTLGVTIEDRYETLRGDGIAKMELVDELEAAGIDADRLLADMISWGTMKNHLNECLDEEKEPASASTDWESSSVGIARDVAREKAEAALKSLRSKGVIRDEQELDVDVTLHLSCQHCPTRVPFEVAKARGYACPDHGSVVDANPASPIDVEPESEEPVHWSHRSTALHSQNVPSFGL